MLDVFDVDFGAISVGSLASLSQVGIEWLFHGH